MARINNLWLLLFYILIFMSTFISPVLGIGNNEQFRVELTIYPPPPGMEKSDDSINNSPNIGPSGYDQSFAAPAPDLQMTSQTILNDNLESTNPKIEAQKINLDDGVLLTYLMK